MVSYERTAWSADIDLRLTEIDPRGCAITGASIVTDSETNIRFDNRIGPNGVESVFFAIDTEEGKGDIRFMQRGDRIHLWHLFVSESVRGERIGEALITIFKSMAAECDVQRVSGRVGNGGTKQFLIKNGFPEDELTEHEIKEGYAGVDRSVSIGAKGEILKKSSQGPLDMYDGFNLSKVDWEPVNVEITNVM